MIDPRIWPVLQQDFTDFQIYEMREMLVEAENLGGWSLDIVPQTLFEYEYCSVCATFYSREVGELWINVVGKPAMIAPLPSPPAEKPGIRVCIKVEPFNKNPSKNQIWPGW